MILTEKAKEDFLKWLSNNYPLGAGILEWSDIRTLFLNALIIEWFDSVGNLNDKGCMYNFKTLYLSTFKQLEKHHSILDIQKIAIKKANEIYNSK